MNTKTKETGKAVLVLEDGSTFVGHGFGSPKKVSGEIVFSTSMVGYPESLTDPSYKGQILTFTYPLVGNYGVPPYVEENSVLKYFESDSIKVTGFVVHELCKHPFHWAST
ncbi:MAG: carbamoyl-phosphate synthase small subunit, partial [Candidatus Bathyarchaeota archaeon]|nr:carbamoyl-phosphate synthase small subunit [Candidatus Bathyarchaeota archaeon]